jgi:hypothetical protein
MKSWLEEVRIVAIVVVCTLVVTKVLMELFA